MIEAQKHCYVLENTAHMGMYENPEAVILAINKFVNE
jgi:pimeloyl-ACP methyl ester carboxylesterase